MTDTNKAEPAAEKKPRGISGTSYPYFDLDASIKVAEVIYKHGGGLASPEQVSAWLGYKSIRGGTYLTRIAAARQFGMVESAADGLATTDRARTILAPVMPEDATKGKVDAFLGVELFSKLYDSLKGTMPPESGLKNLFQQTYKILPDRAPQAVRVFLTSAEQAGFFKVAGDRSRLIKPVVNGGATKAPDSPAKEEASPIPSTHEKPRSHVTDGAERVHSAIIGLLRDLPSPGTVWPPKKKQRFLDAFKAAIDHIYPEEDDV